MAFVTPELHPFTPGGIGRLIYNQILHGISLDPRVTYRLLMPETAPVDEDGVRAIFGDHVTLHRYAVPVTVDDAMLQGVVPREDLPFVEGGGAWYRQSVAAAAAILGLMDQGVGLGTIEFPDYRGLAYATLQARRRRPDLWGLPVTVRIHGTWGFFTTLGRPVDTERMATADPALYRDFSLEQLGLLLADRIICSVAALAERVAVFYGFPPDWRRRVITEPPALGLPPLPDPAPVPAPRERICFGAYLHPWKRPDLFIAAASAWFDAEPDTALDAVLACPVPDHDYARDIMSRIPPRHAARFKIAAGLAPEARLELFATSILVIPSPLEAFCLLAYEGALAGAAVVLDRANPVFGPGTPWIDGQTCIKCEATATGFAEGIARAAMTPLSFPPWQPARPYWLDPPDVGVAPPAPGAPTPVPAKSAGPAGRKPGGPRPGAARLVQVPTRVFGTDPKNTH
jgi:hypothetical protein